jgi:hypothetical protein
MMEAILMREAISMIMRALRMAIKNMAQFQWEAKQSNRYLILTL